MSSSTTAPLSHGHRPGSARAALAYPRFRRMWLASFSSSIGSWMQNVMLPVYVLDRTDSASMVGVMVFAQLGPLLFLSIPAGVIAAGVPCKVIRPITEKDKFKPEDILF